MNKTRKKKSREHSSGADCNKCKYEHGYKCLHFKPHKTKILKKKRNTKKKITFAECHLQLDLHLVCVHGLPPFSLQVGSLFHDIVSFSVVPLPRHVSSIASFQTSWRTLPLVLVIIFLLLLLFNHLIIIIFIIFLLLLHKIVIFFTLLLMTFIFSTLPLIIFIFLTLPLMIFIFFNLLVLIFIFFTLLLVILTFFNTIT